MLDHEESRHDRAGNLFRAIADRFDTIDSGASMHAFIHTSTVEVFAFSKVVETGINLSSLVLLP